MLLKSVYNHEYSITLGNHNLQTKIHNAGIKCVTSSLSFIHATNCTRGLWLHYYVSAWRGLCPNALGVMGGWLWTTLLCTWVMEGIINHAAKHLSYGCWGLDYTMHLSDRQRLWTWIMDEGDYGPCHYIGVMGGDTFMHLVRDDGLWWGVQYYLGSTIN